MNPKRAQLIQAAGEALIPLLGYLFWSWNFYFIALFYFLDLIANTGFLYLKLNKLPDAASKKQAVLLHSLFYLLSLGGIAFLGILLAAQILDGFNLKQQSVDFIMLEDMGLPQGFLLVPLVIYAAYLQYKMKFLVPQQYRKLTTEKLVKKHSLGMLVTLALLGMAYGIALLVKLPEIAAVLGLIVLTTAYSFFITAETSA